MEIISTLVRDGGIAALIYFLGRLLIQRTFDRDLADFKANLEMIAQEHQISFASIYSKRAEILAEVYRGLVETEEAIKLAAGPELIGEKKIEDLKVERVQTAIMAYSALRDHFRMNRLYLPIEMCETLEHLMNDHLWAAIATATMIDSPQVNMWDWLIPAGKLVRSEKYQGIKLQIESQFRELLRVKN